MGEDTQDGRESRPSRAATDGGVDVVPARLTTIWRSLSRDDLLQHGSVMAVAAVASGALNYAYQVFMGRVLGPEQYAVFGALFALFYLVNVLGRGIKLSGARFAAELDDRDATVAAFQRGLLSRSVLFSAGIALVLALASPLVAGFLDVGSPWTVVVVAAVLPFGLPLTGNFGSLQGLQWFARLGTAKVVLAGLKLVLGVALVLLGYGVYGAFGAMVVSSLLVLVLTTVYLRWRLPDPAGSRSFDYTRAYRFGIPAVLVGFCLTVPGNVDVILVKHFFTSHEAGLYTAASVLGKVLVFLPLGISTALFPKVSREGTVDDPARLDALFDRAMLYSAAIGGAGALLYWVAPRFVVSVFFGAAYADAAPLVRWYGLAVCAFVLALVALYYQLARGRTRFVYVFTAVSVGEMLLVWLHHPTTLRVVQLVLLVNLGLLVFGILAVKFK
jgi:O-antigen/teichoic acid export membrane protein